MDTPPIEEDRFWNHFSSIRDDLHLLSDVNDVCENENLFYLFYQVSTQNCLEKRLIDETRLLEITKKIEIKI